LNHHFAIINIRKLSKKRNLAMKQDKRIIERGGLKKPRKKVTKKITGSKKGKDRNFSWQNAEEPIIPEKHGPEGNNKNYRSNWRRKDRL
jgi:hypothetical protein